MFNCAKNFATFVGILKTWAFECSGLAQFCKWKTELLTLSLGGANGVINLFTIELTDVFRTKHRWSVPKIMDIDSGIFHQSIEVICNARNVVHKLESEAREDIRRRCEPSNVVTYFFGPLGLSVCQELCLSVRLHNSKTTLPNFAKF